MNISREPALTAIAVVAPGLQLLVAFLVHDAALQTSVNGAVALLAGVATAAVIRSDKLAPGILGAAQALLAIAIQIGWHPTAEQQAGVMAFVGVLVATYVRTQVLAPVPPVVPFEPAPASLRPKDLR
jgi:hypothetical protein